MTRYSIEPKTRKYVKGYVWVEVNDLSSGQYSDNKNIRFKTSMLRSSLYDYRDAHIAMKGRKSVNPASTRRPGDVP